MLSKVIANSKFWGEVVEMNVTFRLASAAHRSESECHVRFNNFAPKFTIILILGAMNDIFHIN